MSAESSGKAADGHSMAEYVQGRQNTATGRPPIASRPGTDEASFLNEDIAALNTENPAWHHAYHVNSAVAALEMNMPYETVVNLYGQDAADEASSQPKPGTPN